MKEYCYFVSGIMVNNEGEEDSFNSGVVRNNPIVTIKDIREIEKELQKAFDGARTMITNFQRVK